MELSRKTIKRIIFIIFICSVIFLLLQNLNIVFDFLKWCFQIISPFLLGICIAFILNVLMRFIEEKLCAPLNRRYGRVWNKLRRPLCVVLTYGIVIGLVCVLLFLIFPQLSRSFYTLCQGFAVVGGGCFNIFADIARCAAQF